MIERVTRTALFAALLTALAGCGYPEFSATPPAPVEPVRLTLTPTTYDQMPGWRGDRHGAVLPAFLKSCARIGALALEKSLDAGGMTGLVADWRPACEAARRLSPRNDAAVRYFFESRFTPHLAAADGEPEGLFTGYFEAELSGSRALSRRYRVPIYGLPEDIADVKQRADGRYFSRVQIAGGALRDRNLELLWVDDPVDAFFLHVQGSGRVAMDDGSVVRLGYAGDNGLPYVSIGRELVARGMMTREQLSMQSLRAWIHANPEQGAHLMSQNPRYIFFRVLHGQEGPIGAEGVALTPERSLAVDKAHLPFGVPLWVDTTDPLNPAEPFRRLMMAQDTGSAIKGPVRGDIFFGFGEAAAQRAGNMKAKGNYYLLLPRSLDKPAS